MLNQVETQAISVSPVAAQAIKDILVQKDLQGYSLRVFVSGGGCCGMQFGMALDNIIRDNDKTFETQGVNIVVDDASLEHLLGSSIEYVDDPQRGSGFAINNPNAKQEGGSCSSENCAGGSCGSGGGSCSCGGH